MATNHLHDDPLRNPAVDYERADLSARGIVLFLAGLLVAGVFVLLVMWGMFRYLRHSPFLADREPNPMAAQQKTGTGAGRSVLQNAPAQNLEKFPQPRLQPDDTGDMNKFLGSENKVLHPEQPFHDPSGAIHIPIQDAMHLIVQRGLQVRPNIPPSEVNTQTDAGNPKILNEQAEPLTPESSKEHAATAGAMQEPNK